MKRSLVFIALLSIILFGAMQSQKATATTGHKHTAVVQFIDSVQLLNVSLKGRYLVVHDDELMARGEVCTFIYAMQGDSAGKLVASFHCTPVERRKVSTFTYRTAVGLDGRTLELREIQFAGETESHQVPMNPDMKMAVVNVIGR